MSSPKNLSDLLSQDHISPGDIRYMSPDVKAEIENSTANCHGSIRERIFWLSQGLSTYPECVECQNPLTSKHFKTNIRGGGYPRHCSHKCAARSSTVKERRSQTTLTKYGSEQYLGSSDARVKIETTNQKKYGSKAPHPWASERYRGLILEKYGTENIRDIAKVSEAIIKNQINSNISSGKTELSIKVCESRKQVTCVNAELAFEQNRDALERVPLEWQHVCGHTYVSPIMDGDIKVCPKCNNGASALELSLRQLIVDMGVEMDVKNRTVLKTHELDIYVPAKNCAIEFNGIYWHNVDKKTDRYYHLAKTEKCLAQGIKLLHIWEHDFLRKPAIIRSMIRNSLGLITTKISARQCEVRNISSKEAAQFLESNHLRGSINSNVKLGLYYRDELVQVMTLGKCRFNKHYSWEIHRLAGLTDTVIRGGAEKLFKFFVSTYKPDSVLSYADRTYGEGGVYMKLGFKHLGASAPGYFWANTASDFTITRYQSQKHKLKELLKDDFNPALSESENMKRLGWFKLWDCGTQRYGWRA